MQKVLSDVLRQSYPRLRSTKSANRGAANAYATPPRSGFTAAAGNNTKMYTTTSSSNTIDVAQTLVSNAIDSRMQAKHKVTRHDLRDTGDGRIHDKFAIEIENVFTKEECDNLIQLSERCGYERALVNVGGGVQVAAYGIRNNSRCVIDSSYISNEIFQRIRPYLPPVFNNRKLVGVNERLRILRYQGMEEFRPHFDGAYARPNSTECSEMTILFYLNTPQSGGDTNFLDIHENLLIPCKSSTGKILIFQHRGLMHEGCAVNGLKYCIRTDVMYSTDLDAEEYHSPTTQDIKHVCFVPKK